MGVCIATQKEMLDRRRSIANCYICGTPLPPKGPGWRKKVTLEHVIPRALLRAVEVPNGAWPVALYVHRQCETEHKQHRDQLVKVIQQLGRNIGSWSQEEIGLLLREVKVSTDLDREEKRIPYITGADSAMQAPVLWARGMHATLYGMTLPSDMGYITNPPVPIWSEKDGDVLAGLGNYEDRRRVILGLIRVAIQSDKVDEVQAWNGNVLYQCAWRTALLRHDGHWGCMWALEVPGTNDWAMKATGIDSPWHGYYESNQLPPQASTVGQDDIDRFNRFVEESRSGKS